MKIIFLIGFFMEKTSMIPRAEAISTLQPGKGLQNGMGIF